MSGRGGETLETHVEFCSPSTCMQAWLESIAHPWLQGLQSEGGAACAYIQIILLPATYMRLPLNDVTSSGRQGWVRALLPPSLHNYFNLCLI